MASEKFDENEYLKSLTDEKLLTSHPGKITNERFR